MNHIAIAKCSNRYKGNLHSHTIHSDGHLTPEKAKAFYKENGYQFIAFTEHERYTDHRKELNDSDFIVLPGVEISTTLFANEPIKHRKQLHHFLGFLGTEEMQKKAKKPIWEHMEYIEPARYEDSWNPLEAGQKCVDEMRERGMVVTYNHPRWSRVSLTDFQDLEGISGLEVFNYGTENECGLGKDLADWDVMLASGQHIYGFASDDNHNDGVVLDSLGGYVVILAEELSHDALIEAFLAGRYYASSGVEIMEFGIRDHVVYVECGEVQQIHFITDGGVGNGTTVMEADLQKSLQYGEYSLKGTETYVRVECVDKYGRIAWSNPIFIK